MYIICIIIWRSSILNSTVQRFFSIFNNRYEHAAGDSSVFLYFARQVYKCAMHKYICFKYAGDSVFRKCLNPYLDTIILFFTVTVVFHSNFVQLIGFRECKQPTVEYVLIPTGFSLVLTLTHFPSYYLSWAPFLSTEGRV